MKKQISYPFLPRLCALWLAGLLCSCATPPEPPALQLQKIQRDDPAARAVATPFAEALFAALKNDDFARWQPLLPEQNRRRITPAMFRQMRDGLLNQFGTPEAAEYFGMLDQGNVQDHLWKFRFRQAPKQQETEALPHEIIFFVRIYQETAARRPAIAGFGFKPF